MSFNSLIHDHCPGDTPQGGLLEGTVRIVCIRDNEIWAEPEQTTSCGACSASASCPSGASKGIGSLESRLEARRFPLANAGSLGLKVGDRIVLGLASRSLLRGAWLVYGIPLLCAIVSGVAAQTAFNSDLFSLGSMSLGLGLGLVFSRFFSRRMLDRAELTPRFLRFAD